MIRSHNFFFDFFEKQIIPGVYTDLPLAYRSFLQESLTMPAGKWNLLAISNIPDYLGIGKRNVAPAFGCIERIYRLGFAMDLSPFGSASEFLRNQLGKKSYKNLRQDRQRLEKDHQTKFECFYGDIESGTYAVLIETLEDYIKTRFSGRTKHHAALKRWDHYKHNIIEQVRLKNASLFVLWDAEKPIAITVNYHMSDKLFSSINSFDSAYSSYSPGRQMFIRQIEWCYENEIRLIDMGWGSFEYKIKFSNAVYRLKTQVLYHKSNWFMKPFAVLLCAFMELKYFLVMLRDRKFQNPKVRFKNRWLNYVDN